MVTMDKITIVCIICISIPFLFIIVDVFRYFMTYRRDKTEKSSQQSTTKEFHEYDKIVVVTASIEKDCQQNKGEHYPEEIYLNRAKLIGKTTNFYHIINNLS